MKRSHSLKSVLGLPELVGYSGGVAGAGVELAQGWERTTVAGVEIEDFLERLGGVGGSLEPVGEQRSHPLENLNRRAEVPLGTMNVTLTTVYVGQSQVPLFALVELTQQQPLARHQRPFPLKILKQAHCLSPRLQLGTLCQHVDQDHDIALGQHPVPGVPLDQFRGIYDVLVRSPGRDDLGLRAAGPAMLPQARRIRRTLGGRDNPVQIGARLANTLDELLGIGR